MNPIIIDGIKYSNEILEVLAQDVSIITQRTGIKPNLKVIMIGKNPASRIYVENKKKKALVCGISAETIFLQENISEDELLVLIKKINVDSSVNGILVQSPIPKHISINKIIEAISIYKDVDCFHPYNIGNFFLNNSIFYPCTPIGCMHLIRTVEKNIKGLDAVVIGASNIVGKPMVQMLQQSQCTVTNIHLSTKEPEKKSKNADIIVVAVGKQNLVTREWVKKGAIVIDVGINRVQQNTISSTPTSINNNKKITGDTDFENIKDLCRAITPVPGGVGPMTICFLLVNTLKAFYMQNNLRFENSIIFEKLLYSYSKQHIFNYI